jgi:large subunit ribosomal protein L35
MPKQKTSRAAKKRFKVTGAGKLLRRHAMRSHNLEKKSAKRKRRFRQQDDVSGADTREVRRMLGLRKGRS